MKRSNKWKCLICKVDTRYEHFYLLDDVWFKVHNSKKGMLCINCIEDKLERRLTKADFTDCFINRINYGKKSVALIQRLTNAIY